MIKGLIAALGLVLSINVSDAGVSYIRWGRTTCPTGVHVLYAGYMTGPYFGVGGNGGNFLCMHQKPQFSNPVPGRQEPSGYINGVEFDLVDDRFKGVFKPDNIPGGRIQENDMVCVLCYVADSTDQILVPGRQDCGDTGYDFQYKGFLVSEMQNNRGRSQYVCMDEAPEGRPGGTGDDNLGIVYPVQVSCGSSLPCNPYPDGYEVTCAVCTY